MSSVNVTITHDELAHNSEATHIAPFTVSAWYLDNATGVCLMAERRGINPVALFGEVLQELNDTLTREQEILA